LISLAAFLTLIWIGFAQVQATGHQTSPGLLWPMGLFTLPVVVCSILSIFVIPDWLTFNQRFAKDTDMEKYL